MAAAGGGSGTHIAEPAAWSATTAQERLDSGGEVHTTVAGVGDRQEQCLSIGVRAASTTNLRPRPRPAPTAVDTDEEAIQDRTENP